MMPKYSKNILPRSFRFRWQLFPKFWHKTDIQTYHFNALAIFLPLFEKMVVLSIKKSSPLIQDPKLKAEVSSLISQEAIHSREFHIFNQAIIYPHYRARTEQYSLKFFRSIAKMIHLFIPTFHCALSASGEHFTTIAAEIFLKDPVWFEGVDPTLSAIWRWHCIEEIEHQTVAFDVFSELDGRYWVRIMAMFIMTMLFLSVTLKPIWIMLKEDNNHKNIKFYLRAWKYYCGKSGLLWAFCKPYFRFYRPSFHPSTQNNLHLIEDWKVALDSLPLQIAIDILRFQRPSSF